MVTVIPWTPLLQSVEDPVGVWSLYTRGHSGSDGKYGVVRIVLDGPAPGYQAELADGTIVGYYRTLLRAARAVHEAMIDRQRRMREEGVYRNR